MTEHRFRRPDGFEWVTIDTPSEEVLASYPDGTIEIPMVPIEPQDPTPAAVSARQFRLQLRASGIRDQVLAFVAQQSGEVQDAFEYSGTFLRDDPMMRAGFKAVGFSEQQQVQFWVEAAQK